MKRLRIYLDTSVINFLFADDAPEKRDVTRDFFGRYVDCGYYEVAVSALVIAEIERTRDAGRRKTLLDAIAGHSLKQLPTEPREEVTALADAYITQGAIPEKSYDDALHVALCTVNQMDVLLSWNYAHLANVNRERRILAVNQANGYFYPLRIVTPLEVMEDD
ncbi:MAG: PIN domain-containing protein [Candidatus Marinimicrobia bacterium]|nr:PIN domain-containing protein [Candidatus Neomarinimicrobiota bacterium]